MISLVNKSFFLTGMGSGIGLATARLITSLGVRTTAESSLIYRMTVCPRLKNDFNRQKIAKN
jgi:NADP-dependent 3-hydroxy acid dehydrogenase YdfG